eukprot:scaffold8013_cov187-Ochromonas_danica.AAC.2
MKIVIDYAAEVCRCELHANIVETYRHLLRAHREHGLSTDKASKLTVKEIELALFVDAVNQEVEKLHNRVIKHNNSGTTMTSLFLWQKPSEGDIQAIIANVGDSRCILVSGTSVPPVHPIIKTMRDDNNVRAAEDVDFSTHSVRSSSLDSSGGGGAIVHSDRGYRRAHRAATYDTLQGSSVHSIRNGHSPTGGSSPPGGSFHGSPSRSMRKVVRHCRDDEIYVQAVPLSEDHNLSCRREMFRIIHRVPMDAMALPFPLYLQGVSLEAHSNHDYYARKMMGLEGASTVSSSFTSFKSESKKTGEGNSFQGVSISSTMAGQNNSLPDDVHLVLPTSFLSVYKHPDEEEESTSIGSMMRGDTERLANRNIYPLLPADEKMGSKQVILDSAHRLISTAYSGQIDASSLDSYFAKARVASEYVTTLKERVATEERQSRFQLCEKADSAECSDVEEIADDDEEVDVELDGVVGKENLVERGRNACSEGERSSNSTTSEKSLPSSFGACSASALSAGERTPSSTKSRKESVGEKEKVTAEAAKPSSTTASQIQSNDLIILPSRLESYIANRQGPGGFRGPLAYFGRYNHSLLMTRSIGDRFGPRGCLHLPEITSLVIPSNTHVRFVLASDGMWDVIDNHTVRRMGLYYKYNSADALATALARKAHRRRAKRHLRRDDITVTVVDVNQSAALYVKSRYSNYGTPNPIMHASSLPPPILLNQSVEGQTKQSLLPDEQGNGCICIQRLVVCAVRLFRTELTTEGLISANKKNGYARLIEAMVSNLISFKTINTSSRRSKRLADQATG